MEALAAQVSRPGQLDPSFRSLRLQANPHAYKLQFLHEIYRDPHAKDVVVIPNRRTPQMGALQRSSRSSPEMGVTPTMAGVAVRGRQV